MAVITEPPGTPEKFIAQLPAGIEIHVLPKNGALADPLGPGEFVVAPFDRQALPEMIKRIDGVRVVQTMSAGVDDLVGRLPEGIVLCDGAGIHDASVADWTVMTILATYRRLPFFVASQLRGVWDRTKVGDMADLEGVRVLIVGYGSIGRAVEQRLAPFGVAITRVAREARDGVSSRADLPRLLPDADCGPCNPQRGSDPLARAHHQAG